MCAATQKPAVYSTISMATSHHHAVANGANSALPPNNVVLQTDSAGVYMDTGVDLTSV